MSTTHHDYFLLDCPTYEDYLDTFITSNDIRFVRNVGLTRMLVELGYRSKTEIYTPEQFFKHKAAAQESLWPTKKSAMLFGAGIRITDPVLEELADREPSNVQKMISTIVFIKHRLKSGFDVSGYIDFEHSLRKAKVNKINFTDWLAVFQERSTLRPQTHDLSYFDWHKNQVLYNNSDNYVVLHDVANGLIFMHRGDHKKICVDTSRDDYSKNCTRTMHFSEKYGYVVLYDHIIRKKI